MSLLFIIFALFALIFGTGVASNEVTECSSNADGTEQCSPSIAQESIAIGPGGEVMVHAVVNNGPVSPESQEGYVITIYSDGTVLTDEKRAEDENGMTSESGSESTLSPAQLDDVVADLDACGYFELPQFSDADSGDLPVGGSVSVLEVNVNGESWAVNEATLKADDAETLASCQGELADQFLSDAAD